MTEAKSGMVKRYDKRGFGFIQCDDGSRDLFFHISASGKEMRAGEPVEYKEGIGRDGKRFATRVVVIAPRPSRDNSLCVAPNISRADFNEQEFSRLPEMGAEYAKGHSILPFPQTQQTANSEHVRPFQRDGAERATQHDDRWATSELCCFHVPPPEAELPFDP